MDLDFLRRHNVDDLPWRHTQCHPQNGLEYYCLQFPGVRVNGVVTNEGRLTIGIHRCPDSLFYDIGLVDSPRGHEIMTEARVKLGLPIRSAQQSGGESNDL